MQSRVEITELLNLAGQGDRGAEEQALQLLYGRLKQLAASRLRRERGDHTLQPTALVNEAYLTLAGGGRPKSWSDRNHFLAMASRAMRHVLVDHARARGALRRGGDRRKIEITAAIANPEREIEDVIEIDAALRKLALVDERQARIIEMRFFAGLTEAEIAHVLGLSERTVKREWVCGRAWLRGELSRGAPSQSFHA